MEDYILVGLLILIVFLLVQKMTSTYTVSDASGNNFAAYKNIGSDLTGGYTSMVLADSAQFTWSKERVNHNIWTNMPNGIITGTTAASTIWGFRKQLQVGGGGSLWYLIGTDADLLNSANYAQTTAIAEYNDGTNIWEIPNFVIVKLSTVTSVLSCDGNAVTSAQANDGSGGTCTCKAGYYGTGYDNTVAGAPATPGCTLCDVGYWCAGDGGATQCPVDNQRGSGYRQTTVGVGSKVLTACFNSCSSVGAVQSGGSTTTAATCTCSAGYYGTTGVQCTACTGGKYKAAAGNQDITACLTCPQGSSTRLASAATTCTVCADGTYAANSGTTTCSPCGNGTVSNTTHTACNPWATSSALTASQCTAGTYAGAGALSCSNCPAGTYSGAGATSCTDCGTGEWSSAGASGCTDCGVNTYSAATKAISVATCSPCPAGSTSPAGSSVCTFTPLTINGTVGATLPTASFPGCIPTAGIYRWVVPVTKAYTITLTGGGGGGGGFGSWGGDGGIMRATTTISASTIVYLIVGGGGNAASGGGLSAVFITSITTLSGIWMIAGGGGGGALSTGGNAIATPGGGTGGSGTPVQMSVSITSYTAGGAGSNTGVGGSKGADGGMLGAGSGGGGGCGAVSSSSTFLGGTGMSSYYGGFGGGGAYGGGYGGGGGGYTGGAAGTLSASGGTCNISTSGWSNQQGFTTAGNGGSVSSNGGAGSITIT